MKYTVMVESYYLNSITLYSCDRKLYSWSSPNSHTYTNIPPDTANPGDTYCFISLQWVEVEASKQGLLIGMNVCWE